MIFFNGSGVQGGQNDALNGFLPFCARVVLCVYWFRRGSNLIGSVLLYVGMDKYLMQKHLEIRLGKPHHMESFRTRFRSGEPTGRFYKEPLIILYQVSRA